MKNNQIILMEKIVFYVGILFAFLLPTATPGLFAQNMGWTIQNIPFASGGISDIHFINQNTGWAVGTNADNGDDVLLHTTDGGDQWIYQTIDFPAVRIAFTDVNTGYAVHRESGTFYIQKTADGGGTWFSTNHPSLTGVVLESIYFRSENDGWLVGKYDSGQDQTSLLLHTTDGQNWSMPNYNSEAGSIYSIYFTDENNGWAVGNTGNPEQPLVLHTNDSGSNWIKQTTPSVAGKLYNVFFIDKDNGFACGGTGFSSSNNIILFKTTDGGNTWTDLNSTLSTIGHGLHFTSATEGYLSVRNNDGSDWYAKLYKTDDGGVTWTEALNPITGMYSSDINFMQGSLKAWTAGSISPNTPVIATANLSNGPDLGSITVSPSNVTINIGETQQFTATGYDIDGNPMDPPITPMWSTDGGTITQAGLYTAPSTAGDYTVTAENNEGTVAGDTKVHVTLGPGGVVTSVAPTPLAGTAEPAMFTGPIGFQIEVEAKQNTGWAFMHWVNAAPADKKKALATLASPPTEAVAHFAPILTLSPGPKNPGYTTACPATNELDLTFTPVIQIHLQASPADNWEINSVGFQVEGNIKAKNVHSIQLFLGTEEGEFLADTDYAPYFSFPVPPPYNKLKSGSGRTLMVVFNFEGKESLDEDNPIEFTVFTNKTFIGANAEEYPPGVILPPVPPTQTVLGGPIYVGCVHNSNTKIVYSSIQDAIDANETLDSHTLNVCPGTYKENVNVTKSIQLKSIKGYEETIIEAVSDNDHVVHLSKNNTLLDGFSINGATFENKSGVYLKNGYFANTKIMNNKISDNYYGVFLENAQKTELEANEIIENKKDGIHAVSSNGNRILKNTIEKNGQNGIYIENNQIEESQILENPRIAENKKSGIELEKCNKILINENSFIFDNLFGIRATYCDSIKIINNALIGNDSSGISFIDSKNATIQKDSIINNNKNGIYLNNSWSNLIGGNRNNLETNTISSNDNAGILIKGGESQNNIITGNSIGTNADGASKEPTFAQTYGILLDEVSANIIGGEEQGLGNIISANTIGVKINKGNDNVVIGNLIGTDITGTDSLLGNSTGIRIDNSSSNIIGDPEGKKNRNIISGNYYGIHIKNGIKTNKIWGNYIGTDINGEKKLKNEVGIIIENTNSNYIGRYEGAGQGNLISGNDKGIHIKNCDNIYVKGNKIGTNKLGNTKLENYFGGIFLESSEKCYIGGANLSERNIISGNYYGIQIENGGYHKIKGNFIGTDIDGMKKIENRSGIIVRSDHNEIGGITSEEKNVISGNKIYGILIDSVLPRISKNNKIWGNYIGTNVTGNGKLGNKYGIAMHASSISNYIGGFTKGMGNIISGNDIGISLEGLPEGKIKNNKIIHNIIGAGKRLEVNLGQYIGIELLSSTKNNEIAHNALFYNVTTIKGDKDDNIIASNTLYEGTGTNTGISLDGSASKVVGNKIQDDAGNAIVCKNGANPVISKNSIFNNNGYGLLNLDETVTINAVGNWWGNASGPGGVGPGSGDEVSNSVNYSDWQQTPVALVTYAALDTLFIPAGKTDSTFCGFQNWEQYDDVLDVELSDSLGWLQETGTFTLSLKDSLGADTSLHISIPANTPIGTKNKVIITAKSQNNSNWTDSDSFYVFVYNPAMVRIVISPNSVILYPGDTQQFSANGVDSVGNGVNVNVTWIASGGTIDSTGLFTAGEQTGSFLIIATDPISNLKDSAQVTIKTATAVQEPFEIIIPVEFSLGQNYPNPFNPETTISFDVAKNCHVELAIYDIHGRIIAKLVDEEYIPGRFEIKFNALDLPSGLYLYKIIMGNFTAIKKMVVLR